MATEGATERSMAQHPDLIQLRERYELAAETPQAWAVEGLIFLAGTYVAISAWIIGFNAESPALAASNLIVGIALMVLALGFAVFYPRMHGLTWVAPVLGVFLVLAPWLVDGTDRSGSTLASNIIVGLCVIVLGLAVTALPRLREPR
jgi:undecaprenyl pyrophosphate phosphatase UppP